MTIENIQKVLTKIADFTRAHEDHDAHEYQDGLWCLVLEAIAKGAPNAAQLAAAALKTRELDFKRWYS